MINKDKINYLSWELFLATSKIQVEDSVVKGLIDKINKEVEK